jgi:hypothetical protein
VRANRDPFSKAIIRIFSHRFALLGWARIMPEHGDLNSHCPIDHVYRRTLETAGTIANHKRGKYSADEIKKILGE